MIQEFFMGPSTAKGAIVILERSREDLQSLRFWHWLFGTNAWILALTQMREAIDKTSAAIEHAFTDDEKAQVKPVLIAVENIYNKYTRPHY